MFAVKPCGQQQGEHKLRKKPAASFKARDMSDWPDEETDDPHYADDRNFSKVELWTKDTHRMLRMLYAGSNLDRARTIFTNYVRIRPRAQITIRQRTKVLDEWPRPTPPGPSSMRRA